MKFEIRKDKLVLKKEIIERDIEFPLYLFKSDDHHRAVTCLNAIYDDNNIISKIIVIKVWGNEKTDDYRIESDAIRCYDGKIEKEILDYLDEEITTKDEFDKRFKTLVKYTEKIVYKQ